MKKTTFCLIVLLLNCWLATGQTAIKQPGNETVITGAERMPVYLPYLKGKAVAVFANPTSMVKNVNLVDTLLKSGVKIVKILARNMVLGGMLTLVKK